MWAEKAIGTDLDENIAAKNVRQDLESPHVANQWISFRVVNCVCRLQMYLEKERKSF